MDDYADKWLVCTECGRQFLWDAGEQAWYRLKRFFNQPKRCRDCRDRKRNTHIQPPSEMLPSRG
ncbi:MAG: zinc-ribbon domain containing protein [Acidobacteriota bacterium]